MSRAGDAVWSIELPATPQPAVNDDGFSIAHADSSHGLHVVLLGPDGGEIIHEVTPRQAQLHAPSKPWAKGVVITDRTAYVRMADQHTQFHEYWAAYSLPDGERIDDLHLTSPAPLETHDPLLRVQDARFVPGGSLILVHWWLTEMERDPEYRRFNSGGLFTLMDAQGETQWLHERMGDYTVRGDGQATHHLETLVRYRDAILSVAPHDRRFTLWHATEGERVEFRVLSIESEEGRVSVERLGASRYTLADAEGDDAQPLNLQYLGAVPLSSTELSKKISFTLVDPLGRILVTDWETRSIHVFDRSGAHIATCELVEDDLRDSDWRRFHGNNSVDSQGHIFVPLGEATHLRFDTHGNRLGTLDLGGGHVLHRPGTEEVWRLDSRWNAERLERTGDGQVAIERMPDGRWFRNVSDFRFSADGSKLVVLDTPTFRTTGPSLLGVFSGEGIPEFTVAIPGLQAYRHIDTTRDWAALTRYRTDLRLVRFEDRTVHRPTNLPEDDGSEWHWGFSPEGDELWGIQEQPLALHRWALPRQEAVDRRSSVLEHAPRPNQDD